MRRTGRPVTPPLIPETFPQSFRKGRKLRARREHGRYASPRRVLMTLLIRMEQRGFMDVAKVPSEKGPPRKVYSLNALGVDYLEEFWRTWRFLTERIELLHHHSEHQQEEGE